MVSKVAALLLLAASLLVGCNRWTKTTVSSDQLGSLREARQGFQTTLVRRESAGEMVPTPPPSVFQLVYFSSPVGQMAAYLTPDPLDGQKRPAIIWITGGDCNTIGDVWNEMTPDNEQTASAYRHAGIVMMFPSLRGGNMNPGVRESFFGEVDDVLAAADFLASQPHVDPNRIYLGGHSTGGTLALLVGEYSDRFRAVFSFGPVEDVVGYGPEMVCFDTSNPKETQLRAPIHWLNGIQSPVFVIEGDRDSNLDALQAMKGATTSSHVHFLVAQGADHFNVLAPANQLIASRILQDTGPTCNITLSESELAGIAR